MNVINDIKLITESDYEIALKAYTELLVALPEVTGVYTYGGKNIIPGISDLDILVTVNTRVSDKFLLVYNKWKEIGDYPGYIIKHPPLVCSNQNLKAVVLGLGFNLTTIYGRNYDNLLETVFEGNSELWLETLYWDYLTPMFNQLVPFITTSRNISKREFLYLIGAISHSLKFAIKRRKDKSISKIISRIEFYRLNHQTIDFNTIKKFSHELYIALWKSSIIVTKSSLVFTERITSINKVYFYFQRKDLFIFKPFKNASPKIRKVGKVGIIDMPLTLFAYNEIIKGINVINFRTKKYNLILRDKINKEIYSYLVIRNNSAKIVKQEVEDLNLPFATIIPFGNRSIYTNLQKNIISRNEYLFNNYIFPAMNNIINLLYNKNQ